MWDFDKIKQFLLTKDIVFETVEFTDSAISARTADTSVDNNYDPRNSIKTLVISAKKGIFAVVLRGDSSIDTKKLKDIVGKWSVVSKETLEKEYKLIAGGINPFVLNLPFLIDQRVLELSILSMGAGSVSKGINVTIDELKKHLDFKVVDIAKELV